MRFQSHKVTVVCVLTSRVYYYLFADGLFDERVHVNTYPIIGLREPFMNSTDTRERAYYRAKKKKYPVWKYGFLFFLLFFIVVGNLVVRSICFRGYPGLDNTTYLSIRTIRTHGRTSNVGHV